ncbi:MAG: endonuclease III domain-containing protein [Bacillota bacterium]|nr:endonuclease III domain-containing protein [Bacillota bacterium]
MPDLNQIFQMLYAHYGDLAWWPAETPFEVMVGAVLTQNTAWSNVEKAIRRFDGKLSPERIMELPEEELQDIIRPAGFFKQKSQYLKALSCWLMGYDADLDAIRCRPLSEVRAELLEVRGVGNETADSILLYAFDLPTFVVDAYTMRFFGRFPIPAGKTYMEVKAFCEARLPRTVEVYQHFHALIVQNGKEHCRKKMACPACPLEHICQKMAP